MRKGIKIFLWIMGIAIIQLIIFLGGQIFTEVTDYTLTDPILQKVMPSKIKICPLPYPMIHDSKTWIRVNLINDGFGDINQLEVDYKLCDMEKYEKVLLSNTFLKKDDSTYFEIESDLNYTCSYITELKVPRYFDEYGRCYLKREKIISDACSFCDLSVIVYSGLELIGNLTYPYPFFEGGVEMGITKSNCLPYAQCFNKELSTDGFFKIALIQPTIGCIRGDFSREWCKNNGYNINSC